MNTGALFPGFDEAWGRVLVMQKKLHCWATTDPDRCFDDLYNLVCDPAFLVVAWDRVRRNKGARTAGVDGVKPNAVSARAEQALGGLRTELKDRMFRPQPVREVMIPKTTGKFRRLGIPTAADRVVQASLKLVLEPIFEADFESCSYGFRPRRRAQDAIAEIHYLGSNTRNYHWVLEADIAACFDEIDHSALMERIGHRVGDKRVLKLVRLFLRAGILSEDAVLRSPTAGTPQGGILSPLLANIALSILDEHFAKKWEGFGSKMERARLRHAGEPVMKLVRYADDFVIMVHGTREQAEALWDETADVLAPMGLRLSEEKTRVCHLDEGFDFLGFRIQRRPKPGTDQPQVYTYPSKKSMQSIKDKIRVLTRGRRHRCLADLLRRLNPTLRGWCNYFRHGVSERSFSYIDHFAFWRVVGWIRKRHPGLNWRTLKRRHLPNWEIRADGVDMFRPVAVPVTRYRYRGTRIPTPWAPPSPTTQRDRMESRMQ